MASQSRARSEDWVIPVVATLGLHLVLGLGLVAAGWLVDRDPPPPEEDEVDIEPSRQRVALPELPRPLPEPPKLPEPELPTPPPPPARQSQATKVAKEVATMLAPPPADEPPAGEEGVEVAGDPIVLPDVFVKGDVEVGRGTRQGTGGPGGGGPGTTLVGSGGTGPPPVSIAAIKKRAKPLGDVDYLSTRDYPEEARRLGIAGTVKVRLVVDDQGKVTRRTLVKRLGHGLDEMAMKLAAGIRFEPALDADDRPVASVVVWSFDFVPPE